MLAKHLRKILVGTAVLGTLVGGYGALVAPNMRSAHAVPAVAMPAQSASTPVGAALLPDFTAIVEREGGAVVNVSVSGTMKTAMTGLPQLDPNDPFYDFFRRFQPGNPDGQYQTHGLGSGFIVSAEGIILTNAHVVTDANEVTVKLTDRREFKAKVLGIDKATDVAVLKIDAKDLPTVKLGNPQQSRVGEWVVAIGAPFGFENSVTAGIISAKARSLPDSGYIPFLQTDVAINPGNSGGPLFNMRGEVIGINSQIYSRNGGYQGLSFAIPIDIALKIQQQLVEHGKVSRGRLGVMIQEVNQSLAVSFGLPKPEGALVSSVEPGSPAEKAGVEVGDVILKFNGKEVASSGELPPLVADLAPGSHATLEVWRKGQSKALTVSLGEASLAQSATNEKSADPGRLGLAVRPLTPNEKSEVHSSAGLLVENVGGPAARAGVRPGDVILAVNGSPVESAEQLRLLTGKAGKTIALLIQRGETRLFVPLNIG